MSIYLNGKITISGSSFRIFFIFNLFNHLTNHIINNGLIGGSGFTFYAYCCGNGTVTSYS